MRFYLDTNIWIDYYENRTANFVPVGEYALAFLKKAVDDDREILVSGIVEMELKKYLSAAAISSVFEIVAKQIVHVPFGQKEYEDAKNLSRQTGLPILDATHIVLAKKMKAALVTRDNHFALAEHAIEILKPEDLL